ncbi:MAG TPA: ferrochelatase [Verrucomicrobiae bacterium]|nr:ferrochelatase [Verrucomicrobiae bacterium]
MSRPEALLLVSFGGPEGPDDVLPFLENVTRGRPVPRERLQAVAEHYQQLGGRSPINDQNRQLLAAIRDQLDRDGPRLPVYWGNRNWAPLLADAVAEMANAGIRHAAAFITAAFAGYSSCRQYLEDITRARAAVGPRAPVISRLRHPYDHPLFLEAFARAARAARATLPEPVRSGARLVFTAHSVPLAMARAAGPAGGAYQDQLRIAARLVADRLGAEGPVDLVWQSRSGPPQQRWLEPDVLDHLRQLQQQGVPAVVLVPLGFVSDHVEVRYDLDVEARQLADELGLPLARAATPGVELAGVVRALLAERCDNAPRLAESGEGPWPDGWCPDGCCVVDRDPRAVARVPHG